MPAPRRGDTADDADGHTSNFRRIQRGGRDRVVTRLIHRQHPHQLTDGRLHRRELLQDLQHRAPLLLDVFIVDVWHLFILIPFREFSKPGPLVLLSGKLGESSQLHTCRRLLQLHKPSEQLVGSDRLPKRYKGHALPPLELDLEDRIMGHLQPVQVGQDHLVRVSTKHAQVVSCGVLDALGKLHLHMPCAPALFRNHELTVADHLH
mmetsp:Transcript_15287/g.32199  ORF Transcript_15287/g.32199 Transcript_15287/m.32199 type:complete len:206 (-) Transcript_15287:2266-2883(-)